MPNLPILFAFCLLVLHLIKWYTSRKSSNNNLPYPPGPKPLPIIGNALDIPRDTPWKAFAQWRDRYGDIIHLSALGKHVVVINSNQAAIDLLDKRSANYSDRPDIPMANMTGWTAINIGLIHYGDTWRKHRRLFHQKFRQGMVSDLQPLQTQKARELLSNLLHSPEDFREHLRHFPASVIMYATYGYEIAPHNDPIVTLVDEASKMITETILLGAQVVNVIPALRFLPDWMPGTGFKRVAKACQEKVNNMQDVPFETVKRQLNAGTAVPSWTTELFEENAAQNGGKPDEALIKGVAATAFAVAADTSASSLASFVLAMTLYPEVQAKAQAELDAVVGDKRLPDFGDRESMPYIEALCHEVFRWSPAVPIGVPHAALEDDVYNGHFIPAGTMVLANIWAMTRDERAYTDPSRFMPERFLTPEGKFSDDPLPTFGFGRRICVGRFLAADTLWISVVNMLATFNFAKAKDSMGQEIDVNFGYDDSLIRHLEIDQVETVVHQQLTKTLF
ncbi:hypothetical protein HGRIS_014265 [Hohenbuehelia grisea]|uniref:Cytochrome P450 n=1 Tax=Hohenbuehelia grisea TaxID=104357 RepID=A0ABR3JSZ5_9AGAR